MNRAQIKAQVLSKVQNDPKLLDSDLNNYINNAIYEMAKYSELRDDKFSFTSVANQQEYNLPDGIEKIDTVVVNNIPLIPIDYFEAVQEFGLYGFASNTLQTGTPEKYYLRMSTNSNLQTVVGADPGYAVATTIAGNVAIGTQVVSPASMVNIFVGSTLTIDTGANQETVTVLSATLVTFTATFTKTHTGPFSVSGTSVSSQIVIGFYPVFSSALPVVITGPALPLTLTLDTNIPAFPPEYHQNIINWCLYEYYDKITEPDMAASKKQIFMNDVMMMRLDMLQKQPDQVRSYDVY